MPCVSQFYGISICFYYNDDVPPHFHAKYAGNEALFSIESLQILGGRVSPRVRALVDEWATLHHDEVVANWDLARRSVPLQAIDPLE